MTKDTINQDRPPNFRKDDRLYLVRCFACDPEIGKENWAMAVYSGVCAWCGWGGKGNKGEDRDGGH